MVTTANNWYVITGAPSAGKSTVITELAKLGYTTVAEAGRQLIDQKLASGKTLKDINVDSAEFELAWVKLQVQHEAKLNPQQLTFLDRGVLDTLAYFNHYGWGIPQTIREQCTHAAYKKVFLLEILDYEQDYARIEDADTALAMQELFSKVYEDAGYTIVRIPRDTVAKRLRQILDEVVS